MMSNARRRNPDKIANELLGITDQITTHRYRVPQKREKDKELRKNAELSVISNKFGPRFTGITDKIVSELGGKSYDLRRKTKQHHMDHHRNTHHQSHVTHVNQSQVEEREKMWKEEEHSYSLRR